MENRQNIEIYIQGYSDLQAARRTILQDQNLTRARELFAQTPIETDENERKFRATRTYISSTEFDYKTGRLLRLLAISIMLGFTASVVFVLTSKALQQRQLERNNAHIS